MNTRSRKQKGSKLQNLLAEKLREKFKLDEGLERFDGDIQPKMMGGAGVDIVLSPYAKKIIPYDFECKNQESWSIPNWWQQAVANTREGRKPALVISKNRHEPLVIIRLEDFLETL